MNFFSHLSYFIYDYNSYNAPIPPKFAYTSHSPQISVRPLYLRRRICISYLEARSVLEVTEENLKLICFP